MNNKKTKLRYISFVFFLSIFLLVPSFLLKNIDKETPLEVKFTEFMELVEKQEIKSVKVSVDNELVAEKTDGTTILFPNPRDDDFTRELLEQGVDVTIETSSELNFYTVFTIVSEVGLIIILLISMKSFSRNIINKNNLIVDTPSSMNNKVSFDDIGGLSEVKEDLLEIVDYMKNPEKYQEMGATCSKGVLLVGPPGVGKTLIAKAIASEAGLKFFSVNSTAFINKFVGVGPANIRQVFSQLKKEGKAILFIDEIDTIGRKRGTHSNDEADNTLNALLTEMDGFIDNPNILIIAATNKAEQLDEALTRGGRFGKQINLTLPTTEERAEIIKKQFRGKKVDETVDINQFARMTIGFCGGDIAETINEAARLAVKHNHKSITFEDLDESFNRFITKGFDKKSYIRTEEDNKMVAWHEAGHAITIGLLGGEVNKITIIENTSGAGGYTLHTPEDKMCSSKESIERDIMFTYGGRAAEEILFGTKDLITNGCCSDISEATKKIKAMVYRFGMSKCGLLDYTILNQYPSLINEIESISFYLYRKTRKLLQENKDFLEELANLLLEKNTIYHDEFTEMLKKYTSKKTEEITADNKEEV